MDVIRYVAADDHKLFLKGFQMLLKSTSCRKPLECVGEAYTNMDLIRIIGDKKPDLLFLDLNLADHDASENIPTLKELNPDLRILVVSMYTDEKGVRDALKKGADGYLSKNTDLLELSDAINSVMDGEVVLGKDIRISNSAKKTITPAQNLNRFNAKYQLTKREKEILELVAKGKSNRDIANLLFISKDTVSVHRKNLMRKLDVKNASGLLKIAYEFNLIS